MGIEKENIYFFYSPCKVFNFWPNRPEVKFGLKIQLFERV